MISCPDLNSVFRSSRQPGRHDNRFERPQLLEEGGEVFPVPADLQHPPGHPVDQVAAQIPECGPVRPSVADEGAQGVGNFRARHRARHVQARHQAVAHLLLRRHRVGGDRLLGHHEEEDGGGGLEEAGAVPTLLVQLLVGSLYPRDDFGRRQPWHVRAPRANEVAKATEQLVGGSLENDGPADDGGFFRFGIFPSGMVEVRFVVAEFFVGTLFGVLFLFKK